MKDNKYIYRFMASVALCAYAYCGVNLVTDLVDSASGAETPRPYIHLTSGESIDPATATVTTKFDEDSAKDFALGIFGDAEEAPDLNEFLSRFTCSSCGKRCLLAAPSCFVSDSRQDSAMVIYQEMYPEAEL